MCEEKLNARNKRKIGVYRKHLISDVTHNYIFFRCQFLGSFLHLYIFPFCNFGIKTAQNAFLRCFYV